MPSFTVLKGGGVTYLKIQLSTFLSMIIYIFILKISIIWTNPVMCHILQNEVLIMSMSNLSFLDNKRMYQIFSCIPNIKKQNKIKKSESWKAMNKRPTHSSAPQHINVCKDTVCLLTLKCLFFKKLVAFYTAIQRS